MSGCLSWREIEALADGAGDASAREHAARCARCSRRLTGEVRYREAARALAQERAPAAPEALLAAAASVGPSRPIDCRRVRRFLDAYLDGRLPAKALADFEAHLFTCRACYMAYRQALDLRDALAALTEAPPEGLLERVLSSVAAVEAEPVPARPRRIATAWALSAAAVVVGVLIAAVVLMRQPSPPQTTGPAPHTPAGTRAFAPKLEPMAHAPTPKLSAPAPSKASRLRPARLARAIPRAEAREPAKDAERGTRVVRPSPVFATTEPSVSDRPVAAAAPAMGPTGKAVALPLAPSVPSRTALLPPAPVPTPPSIGEVPAPPVPPAPTPPPASMPAVSRPEPTPAPSPPLRLAEATTDVRPRWLPVREAPAKHISPEPSAAESPLEAVASRVNERLHEDELASGAGWIRLK